MAFIIALVFTVAVLLLTARARRAAPPPTGDRTAAPPRAFAVVSAAIPSPASAAAGPVAGVVVSRTVIPDVPVSHNQAPPIAWMLRRRGLCSPDPHP